MSRAHELLATGDEFATVCGLVALGRHLGQGDDSFVEVLHAHASDDRWRVREGVAMALQRAGDDDPCRALDVAEAWQDDPDPLVRRAAIAAVAEPRLLVDPAIARRALNVVDRVTAGLLAQPSGERRSPNVRTLRQALGYCWSVVIAAQPAEGLAAFRRLEDCDDADVAWIVRENRRKARLRRLLGDPARTT